MPSLVLEIHVPLTVAPDVPAGGYAYPWIEDVEEHLFALEESGEVEVLDDGEEFGSEYLFFITGAPRDQLVAVASAIAQREGIPAGTFAVLTDDAQKEMGTGERIEL